MQDVVKITLRMPRDRYADLRVTLLKQGLTVQSLFDCLATMYETGDLPPEITARALMLQSEKKEGR